MQPTIVVIFTFSDGFIISGVLKNYFPGLYRSKNHAKAQIPLLKKQKAGKEKIKGKIVP
jgi:hypothetical protein